jgi:hypothetical protein
MGDQRRREREDADGERGDPGRLETPRERSEEDESEESREERHDPQRVLRRAENRRRPLREREESRRGDLVEVERLGDERAERPVKDVFGERDLVDPERRVREVLPEAERDARDDEDGDDRPRAARRAATEGWRRAPSPRRSACSA